MAKFFHCPLIKNPDHIDIDDIAEFDLKIGEKGTCRKCGADIHLILRYYTPWVKEGDLIKEVFFHSGGKKLRDFSVFIVHPPQAVYDVS